MEPAAVFVKNLGRARGLLGLHVRLHGRPGRPEQHTPDLLRAVVVLGVAALDAYVHQKVVGAITRGRLSSPPEPLKARVKELVKKDPDLPINLAIAPAPFEALLTPLVESIYKETYQDPGTVERAFELVGIPGIWASVANALGEDETTVKRRLAEFVQRRHAIAHEADIRRGRGTRTAPITRAYAEECLDFLEKVVRGMETVPA